MAGVPGFERRELVAVRLDGVGELQQQPAAIGGRRRAPRGERRARGVDRAVDVDGLRLGHVGELRAVVRIEDLERRAVGRVDERAADEELVLHALSFLTPRRGTGGRLVRSRPRPAGASRSTTARAAAGRRSPRRGASNASARSPDGGCRPASTRRRPAFMTRLARALPLSRSSTFHQISSESWTNHSTRSLPWMIGRMYSSVVGHARLFLHAATTDGFHVTSDRDRYANRLNDAMSPSKPGSGITSGSSCVTSVKCRLIGNPDSSLRICSSPGTPTIRLRGDAVPRDRALVVPVLGAERRAGLGRARERIEPFVRPVVEHLLERLADQLRREVLHVVELRLAVGVVVPTGEQIDGAVVVHGARSRRRS